MSLTRLLLVEGARDQEAVIALLGKQRPSIKGAFYKKDIAYDDDTIYVAKGGGEQVNRRGIVVQQEGYDALRRNLNVWLKYEADLKYLGIVVDADTSVTNRWQSLWGGLSQTTPDVNNNLPSRRPPLPHDGFLIVSEIQYKDVQIGVWIMPNNQFPARANNREYGIMESFLGELIAPATPLWEHAKNIVTDLPNVVPDHEIPHTKLPKANLYTWLAWQAPGMYVDAAIKEGFINPAAPLVQTFIRWVQRVFALEVE